MPPTMRFFSILLLTALASTAVSGRVIDLAVVNMDPRVFYVASATGGVWKTTDNRVRFTPVFQNEATHSVGDVVVHRRDTSIVWVGTGERASRQSSSWGDGVYKSTDGGQNWRNMGLRDSHHIGRMNRAVWNLRHGAVGAGGGGRGGFGGDRAGPWVVPGLYTVRLSVADDVHEQTLRVKEDPRIEVDPLVRRQWTEMLLELGGVVSAASALTRESSQAVRRLDDDDEPGSLDAGIEGSAA